MPKPTFGTILRRELDRAGVSVSELARRCDVSRAAIYNLLNDSYGPSLDLAGRIADALGVSVDLLRGEN